MFYRTAAATTVMYGMERARRPWLSFGEQNYLYLCWWLIATIHKDKRNRYALCPVLFILYIEVLHRKWFKWWAITALAYSHPEKEGLHQHHRADLPDPGHSCHWQCNPKQSCALLSNLLQHKAVNSLEWHCEWLWEGRCPVSEIHHQKERGC